MTFAEVADLIRTRIAAVKSAFGAPGDWGYDDPKGESLYGLYTLGATVRDQLDAAAADLVRDAARYRWLRERNLDTIDRGGVFAGQTPDNLVLNGADLDAAIDAARARESEGEAS